MQCQCVFRYNSPPTITTTACHDDDDDDGKDKATELLCQFDARDGNLVLVRLQLPNYREDDNRFVAAGQSDHSSAVPQVSQLHLWHRGTHVPAEALRQVLSVAAATLPLRHDRGPEQRTADQRSQTATR